MKKYKSKYAAIIKVDNEKFIKYNYVRNPYKLYIYIEKHYPNWRYCNLFSRETGLQVGNFTKKSPPSRNYFPKC